MTKYFLKRLLLLFPKLLVITLIIFLGMQLVPGDAASRMISPDQYAELGEGELEALRERLGLNRPLYMQYFSWIAEIFRGNMGYSIVTGISIADLLAARLPATLLLSVASLIIATVFGLLLGYISAIKRRSFVDYANSIFAVFGISTPTFFLGLLAILFFSIRLGWFPAGGRMDYYNQTFLGRMSYLVLPSVSLGLSYVATLLRFTKSAMIDVINLDYIKTARSKGLSEAAVNFRHGFRNALIPIMVILVMRLPMLISGSVVIESVFNYPGMGSLLLEALSGADMPVVLFATMFIALIILLSSFLVDLFTALLDPRVRLS